MSDIHMSSLSSVLICNKTSPVVLSPVEEDATYTYHCVARNTYNASDGNATEQNMFSTTRTGREYQRFVAEYAETRLANPAAVFRGNQES